MSGSYTVISILYLTSGLFIFLLGLTILRIGRSSAPTRATALMLFFAGVGPILTATSLILENTLRQDAVLYGSMLENFEYLWEFYFPSLMLFSLSFPRENQILRRFPILGFFVFFPYIFHLIIMMSGDRLLDMVAQLYRIFPEDGGLSFGSRVVSVSAADDIINAFVRLLERVHRNAFAVVNISYAALALFLLWRNRRELVNPRLTVQLRTVSSGIAVSMVVYAFAKMAMMFNVSFISDDIGWAMINLSLVASGGTIAYAVIRQQFLGIRHVFRRSALYSCVAVAFALLYLVVVRPISTFFGQYSDISKDVFETGFIIITILVFQPTLIRVEEILEGYFLKGRVDAGRRFHQLGEEVAAATTQEDLMDVLKKRLRETLDASLVRLEMSGDDAGAVEFCAMLEEIGEPVRDSDLHRLRDQHQNVRRGWFGRKRTTTVPAVVADALFGQFDKDDYDVYVPLFRKRRCIGYLGLGVKIYGVPYSSEELGRLSSLSTQIGAALLNIRLLAENVGRKLLEEELNIARKIQSQLLPGDPPVLPGFELYAATVPSRHVGGDYYDFEVIDERWLVIVVADVSGKGIPASILTATLQATVRSNEDAQTDPEKMMERLNRLLYKNTSSAEFATLFYTVVDLDSGAMRYTNAGHEFPFLVNGPSSRQLTESGIVLGCLEDFHYEENTCQIPPNGSLVIYTDGVTDAETIAGEYYGTDRLQATLQNNAGEGARSLCRIVIEDVRHFATGENQDDLTIVVLTRAG